MSDGPTKHVVTVTIADEEYTLRAMSTPEHALRCAALVDRSVREVLRQSSLVQPQKAAILAALTLADKLLHAEMELDALRRSSAAFAGRLSDDVEQRLAGH
jgi:cell division protein ZapA (FtsZ GTPase activity inhibitor)